MNATGGFVGQKIDFECLADIAIVEIEEFIAGHSELKTNRSRFACDWVYRTVRDQFPSASPVEVTAIADEVAEVLIARGLLVKVVDGVYKTVWRVCLPDKRLTKN